MERRTFLKASCSACIAMAMGGLLIELAGCSSLPIYKTGIINNKVTVPLSLFTETNLHIIRPANLGYDIAVRKEVDGTYTALLLRCTHADNPLVSTGNGFVCNLHGSTFDKEGSVTQGPAEKALTKYHTLIQDTNIVITIQ